ncbi:MAG: hypothetical protein WB760_30210 [Xanthobacteraceae bacterium]
MDGNRAPWRRAGLAIAATLLLGACGGHHLGFGDHDGDDIHAFPDHYKTDILSAMHAYLNDPSGIRDASISEPMLKSISAGTRYVVCLRFNGKQNNGAYTGVRQIAAVFLAGRFDDFIDPIAAREPCNTAAYTPFPELEKLQR